MIGLLPAAGNAERMGGLPKMLLPVPEGTLAAFHGKTMLAAGCDPFSIGANRINYDLLRSFYGGYVRLVKQHETMTETILSLREDMKIVAQIYYDNGMEFSDNPVLFGMPDTHFEDAQAYQKLTHALNSGADLAVGLFHTRPEQRSKLGMCRLDGERITDVIDKPESTTLEWAWGVLGWQPVFWQYLRPEDPHVGYAIPRAIAAGLDVRAVKMVGGYWDCGTPAEYFEMIRSVTGERENV